MIVSLSSSYPRPQGKLTRPIGPRPRASAQNILRWALLGCLGIGLLSCRGKREPVPEEARPAGYERGASVLVEARAAEFFEARVLSSQGERLRLLPANGGESVWVARDDVYRLPPSQSASAGQWAICAHDSAWRGCRVVRETGQALLVETSEGASLTLAPSAVARASPLTEMNLRRAFTLAKARREFLEQAARAGRPRAPSGYRAALRSRVLAPRRGGWYLGTVRELHKEDVEVAFESDNQRERIDPQELVPEPPASEAPARGAFALVRPHSNAEAWLVLRVIGAADREFRVVNDAGEERVVSPRDILPLYP